MWLYFFAWQVADDQLLKEVADEIDLGTQYHLTRFAFLYESTVVNDGTTLNPMGAPDEGESPDILYGRSAHNLGPGLKAIFEAIDNRTDFKSYMQNYAVARGSLKGPRRDGPYDEGFVSSSKQLIVPELMVATASTATCAEINRSL